jgi:DNA polymerase I-like protein with 3'-5' exonuclease and polymerase domains
MRLCLNNPVQATSAHQTKLAVINLFKYIRENNHQGLALICIVPHDEIVMEVHDTLCAVYKEKLGQFMVDSGNKFLTNPLLKMGADANVGSNWYEAK